MIREIVLHGETMRELILFFPEERVEFIRLSGKAKGQIKNILEEDSTGKLYLRFTFDLVLDVRTADPVLVKRDSTAPVRKS